MSRRSWEPGSVGVLCLPSGRLIRGRGLSKPLPEGPLPDYAVYLQGRPPPAVAWEFEWVRWRDFRLPSDVDAFRSCLRRIYDRAPCERVEIACTGGSGRTGTAMACLAIMDGVPAREAVDFVRAHYRPRAVETPGQRRFVRHFVH